MRVKLYTAPGCDFCRAMREHLRECGIPFEERSVADPEVARKLTERGVDSVPAVEVDGKLTIGYSADWVRRRLCGR